MSIIRRTLLVTGATGRQGRAFVSSLLSADSTQYCFHILALTRNPASEAAKALLTLSPLTGSDSEVTLIKGDLDDHRRMRQIFEEADGGVWGVFIVLAFPGLGAKADGEEKQGISVVDLSLEFGVSHLVFSSVERGGEGYDDHLVLDRAAKVKIERHIKSLTEKGLKWTILRPGFFMENFDGTIGKITAAVLRCGLKPTTPIQLVAAEDIGHVGAAIFLDSEKHVGGIIIVVGDVLTTKEQDEAHERATGRRLPSVPDFVAKPLLALNGHTRDLIADIERVNLARDNIDGGHEVVILDCRQIYPGMMNFEEWAWRRAGAKGDRPAGWNRVSVPALVLGKQ
ncbi:NAD(P)-binding protein [Ramaria rubella]|nr:NAD(P)-binding protein [Ramaria rubella]